MEEIKILIILVTLSHFIFVIRIMSEISIILIWAKDCNEVFVMTTFPLSVVRTVACVSKCGACFGQDLALKETQLILDLS